MQAVEVNPLTANNNELLKKRIQHLVDDMGGFNNVQIVFKECGMSKDLMRNVEPTTEELLKFEELLLDQQMLFKNNQVLLEDDKGSRVVVNADSLD